MKFFWYWKEILNKRAIFKHFERLAEMLVNSVIVFRTYSCYLNIMLTVWGVFGENKPSDFWMIQTCKI